MEHQGPVTCWLGDVRPPDRVALPPRCWGGCCRHDDGLQAKAPGLAGHARGQWKGSHSDTFLITGSQGEQEAQFAPARYSNRFGSGYQDRINKGQFAFPVDEDKLDGRLPANEIMLIVEAGETGDSALAFPPGVIGDSAANSDVGGEPVVVFTAPEGPSVGGFSRTLDGGILTFDRNDDDKFTDRETTSRWDFAGRAVGGPLTGERL